ncbi:hypothetical protein AQUCO_00900317v1 [Aquilegia coerulea]|uniref:tRNA/rRNA methyltransferase SpoU type domain-containing protein n=1 Tax=Aquilegia coerulea TaxID=218851 RepID=A0A2G5ED16_AQUCA|nr:hypothetical protein AQUCO_00900317v1 [Aquilegia coerulea]
MMCNSYSFMMIDSCTGLRTLNSILFPLHHLRSRASLFRPFILPEIYKAKKKKKPNVYGLSICSSSPSSYRNERVEMNCLPHGAGEAVNGTSSHNKLLQVVLVSPQIPGNTGCIARTCAASSVGLHLVEPLGYKVEDSKLKRAGLDYWPYVVVKIHGSWSEFREYFRQQEGEKRLLAFTKRGTSIHSVRFPPLEQSSEWEDSSPLVMQFVASIICCFYMGSCWLVTFQLMDKIM